MVYITKSNFSRILRNFDFREAGKTEGVIYKKPIYFLSNYEKNSLITVQEILKDPNRLIGEYYLKAEVVDNFEYIFEGGKPAYHIDLNCERLNSNFRNFKIPSEIKEKGKDSVLKFRKWCKENDSLFESQKSDLIVERIRLAFGVIVNPKAVDFSNSGVELKDNFNLGELEEKIDEIIADAGKFYKQSTPSNKEIIKRFQKYTFLAYKGVEIENNDTGLSDENLKTFLRQYDIKFKRPIKNLLMEYYRIKFNPELKFEGPLLEQLGFKPCAVCHGEYQIEEELDLLIF